MDEFLTEAEFLALPETGTIDPHRIRFSQDTISNRFKIGILLEEVLSKLASNSELDEETQKLINYPIRIVRYRVDGDCEFRVYSLDNRRLWVHQQANRPINYVTVDPCPEHEEDKFTTDNLGISVIVKRSKFS